MVKSVTQRRGRNGRKVAVAICVALGASALLRAQQPPLTQLQFDIVGIRLTVDPPTLTVPKGIPTFVNTKLETGQDANGDTATAITDLTSGTFVEAELRGPSITPTRILARPGQPLTLPAFALPGDYFLDQIRLVKDGQTVMDAQPSVVPIKVINEVFITSVSSRPLTLTEIQEKGIVIDEKNFQIIEFQIAFDVGGRKFKIDLPSALPSPAFVAATSPAKLQSMLLGLNSQLTETVRLPPELDLPGLNFAIAPLPFYPVEDDSEAKRFGPPPITGLVVIPGNVAFLNQFFSAIVIVTNVAPDGTPLILRDVEATLTLPNGLDGVAGEFDTPGDDPLRLARIEGVGTRGTIAIVQAGPDGTPATFDDITFIAPQQSGDGEFLVEGLSEGGHTLDIAINAVLHGLPSGPVRLTGNAAGAVLVRNPNFSLTLGHPRTIRAGEPYSIFATITNTSRTPANLVSVNLDPRGISGAQLVSDRSVVFQTLKPGDSATAQFRLIAQKTGQVNFSSVNTGKGLTGAFQLTTGIGERGIPLAPNAIVLPGPAAALPDSLIAAAQRVLGQAFSIATAPAGTLPPDVFFVRRQTVIDRGIELGEAGQRLELGESQVRVIQDLLLDWMGHRAADEGFDQLLRTTEAGAAFMQEIASLLTPSVQTQGVLDYQHEFARAVVHGTPHILAITGNAGAAAPVRLSISDAGGQRMGDTVAGTFNTLPFSDVLRLQDENGRSELAVLSRLLGDRYVVEVLGDAAGTFDLGLVIPAGPGQSLQLRYAGVTTAAGALATVVIDLSSGQPPLLQVDLNGDGLPDDSVSPTTASIVEEAPQLLVLRQLPQLNGTGPEDIADYAVSGLIVAALFDKPVTLASAELLENYSIDGNEVTSAKLQPSRRLAYLLLRKGIGTFFARTLNVRQIEDDRGHALPPAARPIQTVLNQGSSVFGQVRTAVGDPVPDTLISLSICCVSDGEGGAVPVLVSQIKTDIDGAFQFDYVTRFGQSFVLAANHSITGETASIQARVRGVGERMLLNLTFIGRGIVAGRVLQADGVTPVPNVPVILTPQPGFVATDGQRDLRGAVSNDAGEYVISDVPVGNYTVAARDTRGFFGQASGVLGTAGARATTDLMLTVDPSRLGRVTGRVFGSDGTTPIDGAAVYVGRRSTGGSGDFLAFGRATSDAAGAFAFDGIPQSDGVDYEVVAVDPATQQLGKAAVNVLPARNNGVVIVMEATGRVEGVVRNAQGQVVPGALIAGGVALGLADANGFFRIEGVPAGQRTIEAGDPVTKRRGQTTVTVLPAQTVSVEVVLEARATIVGRVFDAQGNPVPKATVRIPQNQGFIFVFANNQGLFRFPDLPLGDYLIQAPGPDQAALILFMKQKGIDPRSAFTMGDIPPELGGDTAPRTEADVINAYKEALRSYLKLDDPFIVGPPPIPGGGFGWNKVRLLQDSITVSADVKYLAQGTVSGRTMQANGVPTGALVRVNSLVVSPTGAPKFDELERKNSDAQTGAFSFGGIARFDLLTFQAAGIRAGDFSLEAATPFSPVIAQFAGQLNPNTLNMSDIELRFPPVTDTNGTVSGLVLMPDGVTPAPENTDVTISFGDLTVRTDAQGRFHSALPIPGDKYYVVTATSGGLKGQATARVPAGGNVDVTIRLTGLGQVLVTARRGNGTLLVGAPVRLERGQFPATQLEGVSDANGQVRFVNVPEGAFSAAVEEPITGLRGRASGVAIRDHEVAVTVVVAASGRVVGTFVQVDGITPIGSAQIVLRTEAGVEAYAVTDGAGRFELHGIPTGRFTVGGRHLLTGRQAQSTGEVRFEGDVASVTLIELASGRVDGFVLHANGVTQVPGATVEISSGPSFNKIDLQVSARADGSYTFEGVPVGPFSLSAKDPLTLLQGSASGDLAFEGERVTHEILLEAVGQIKVRVLDSGGAPVPNARIELGAKRNGVTDTNGEHVFDLVGLGSYAVRAHSLAAGREHDGGVTTTRLESADQVVEATVRFGGIGDVLVSVVGSDGVTPIPSARVVLTAQGSAANAPPGAFEGTFIGFTDANGVVRLQGVPVGAFFARAESGTLSGLSTGAIQSPDQEVPVTVRLIPSGTIRGRLILPDAVTPAAQAFVTLSFAPQSSLQSGKLQVTTDLTGTFSFAAIPLGAFTISGFEPVSKGVRTVLGSLVTDGQVLDLGDIVLDNVSPRVVQMTPSPGSNGVRANAAIVLTLSEALRPATVNPASSFNVALRDGQATVPGVFAFSNGNTTLTFTPSAALRSMTSYTMTVRGAPDGPEDTEGFRLLDAFVASFVVEDNIPPVLLSASPVHGAAGVLPDATVRLTFSESIAPGYTLAVTGPGGAVAGEVASALGGTVAIFSPTEYLQPNSTYSVTLASAVDLAGNLLAGGPATVTFATVDTLAPTIQSLALVGNPTRIAGSAIVVRPSIVGDDVARVEFVSAQAAQVKTVAPFDSTFTLPDGTAFIEVIATAVDHAGNRSPASLLRVDIAPNAPPVVTLTNTSGITRPAPGQTVTFQLAATDDVALSELVFSASGAVSLSAGALVPGGAGQFAQSFNVTVPAGATGTFTVQGAAIDSVGNRSVASAILMEIGEGVPPTVVSVDPANNAVDVALTQAVTVVFNETILAGSVNPSTFSIAIGGVAVPGARSVEGATIRFVPTSPYPLGADVFVTTAGVQDLAGNGSASVTSRFRTIQGAMSMTVGSTLLAVNRPTVATITLPAPAPQGGVVVTVTSSAPAVLGIGAPGTISVGAGVTSGTIALNPVAPGSARVTASAPGFAPVFVDVVVTDRVLSLPASLLTTVGQTADLSIAIQPTPTSALTLQVSSGDPTGLEILTPIISVAAGQTNATASVRSLRVGSVEVSVSAAGYAGATTLVSGGATLDIVEVTTALAAGLPGAITVRLQGNGSAVMAPAGGVALTVTTSNAECVVVSDATLAAGSLSASISVNSGVTTTLPCTATITVSSAAFGSDTVSVTVFRAESVYSATAAVSVFNPAPVPPPGGQIAAGTASVSYYNPAQIPSPGGSIAAGVAAVSYFNPASIPSPGGTLSAGVSAVSYFNPAPIPSPTGTGFTNVVSVSFENPATPLGLQSLLAAPSAVTAEPQETSSPTVTVSVANGPVATALAPVRLSRSALTPYTLTISGANLAGATALTFSGLENEVSVGSPIVVSGDGRTITADIFVQPTAPLGVVEVTVRGSNWSTATAPQMRVEIVP